MIAATVIGLSSRERSRSDLARILVHAPNWVGDHAMAFPFYAALRSLFPKAHITLVGRSWVSDLVPAGIDEVITLTGKKISRADSNRIKELNFDLGFTLSPSFRSAWLLKRLGVRLRYGFFTDMRSWLLSAEKNHFKRNTYNRTEHRALAYTRLLNPFLPANVLAEDIFARYRDTQLSPLAPGKIRLKPGYMVICPGSTAAAKKYPVQHFIRVIELIATKQKSLRFILLGANIDLAECDAIATHFAGTKVKLESLCGETSLREAHSIIAAGKLCIANDSGLAHLTSLTRTPLITFNGMGRREETAPLTQKKMLLDLQLACSPCFKKVCPRKDAPLECLAAIDPGTVAQHALALLKGPRRSI